MLIADFLSVEQVLCLWDTNLPLSDQQKKSSSDRPGTYMKNELKTTFFNILHTNYINTL